MVDNCTAGPSGQADQQPPPPVAPGEAAGQASAATRIDMNAQLSHRDLPPPDYDTAVAGGATALPKGYQPSVVVLPDEPPPEYSVAANLPTYDQAERSKSK